MSRFDQDYVINEEDYYNLGYMALND
jgi:hypothetical protein